MTIPELRLALCIWRGDMVKAHNVGVQELIRLKVAHTEPKLTPAMLIRLHQTELTVDELLFLVDVYDSGRVSVTCLGGLYASGYMVSSYAAWVISSDGLDLVDSLLKGVE